MPTGAPTTAAPVVPINVTVQIFDSTFVYRGVSNWTDLWSLLSELRTGYGVITQRLSIDVTTAIFDDPNGVQTFVNEAALRGIEVELLLTNQNWAFTQNHIKVRPGKLAAG